jgi:hypothetical protein
MLDNVREGAQARGELEVRRGAERLRPEPQALALGQALDVAPVTPIEIVAKAFQTAVFGVSESPELPHGLLCDRGTHGGTIVLRRHLHWPR